MTFTETQLNALRDERMPNHLQPVIHQWLEEPMTTLRYNILCEIAHTPRKQLLPLYIVRDQIHWINPTYIRYTYYPKDKRWRTWEKQTQRYPTLLPMLR